MFNQPKYHKCYHLSLLNDAVMTQATSEQKVNTCTDQRQTMYH